MDASAASAGACREEVHGLLAAVPGDERRRRLGAGDDLAAADHQPPGGHQPDGVALGRRVEEDQVRLTSGLQPVVPQPKGARASANVRPPAPNAARPAAPPAYRPQPTPKVLQRKVSVATAHARPSHIPASNIARGPATRANVAGRNVGVVQRRGYENTAIDAFINANKGKDEFQKEVLNEDGQTVKILDVNAITESFKASHQYHDRSDLKYLRKTVSGHRSLLKPYPTRITYPLTDGFNNHVLGKDAGVGWHTESAHANGALGYSYANWGWISQTKKTYWATSLTIKGTDKTGNDGNGTFFPEGMTIDEIRSEALYVANSYPKHGQVVIGRGQSTGIMIECIIRDDKVESAYPYKPGW